jgi:isocitrate dehydrogenase
MAEMQTITIAKGDGIGPEIMDSTLEILKASGVPLQYEEIEVGEQVYISGNTTGISEEAWATIRKNKAFLKAPITTPQGGGYKSLNVTIRKTLGLYANVRPCKTFRPFIPASCKDFDMVIVRENEEDLYAGIEYQQTNEAIEAVKLISKPGSERIIRYAFEYAKVYGRKKVTCMSKDNIMKHTDGMFHSTFKRIAKEYPEIEAEHSIIDIGSARVAANPEDFDVIVTLNLYGDIISDIMAQVAGSVGVSGSSNVADGRAMFEAIHGSAPDIAGQDIANPCGLLHGAILMLDYLGMSDFATKIEAAALCTMEEGIHTADLYQKGISTRKVGTKDFTQAVIERLGKSPKNITVRHRNASAIKFEMSELKKEEKTLVGVDLFLDWDEQGRDAGKLGDAITNLSGKKFTFGLITNRGVKVWPGTMPETYRSDQWRLRFKSAQDTLNNGDIIELMSRITDAGFDIIKTDNLYNFDGERAYSLAQGE